MVLLNPVFTSWCHLCSLGPLGPLVTSDRILTLAAISQEAARENSGTLAAGTADMGPQTRWPGTCLHLLVLFASELASSSSRTSSHGNKMSAPEQKVLDFLQRDSLSQAPHRGHCSWCDTQGHMPDPADWEGWPQPHGSGGEMWLPERNGGAATRIRVTDARRQVYSCSDLWVSY